MSKKKLGPQPMLWPHPAILVGTVFDGGIDFATYAWTGVAASTPPAITVGIQHHRHTLKGIYQNRAFSVNIPSQEMVKETDYCGLVTGAKADKVKDCGFKIFYGTLDTAPLIEQCPINLELEVVHILNMGSHALVIGKIIETYVSEECLTDGKPDIMKIKPLIFSLGSSPRYNAVGDVIANAFSIGKELKAGEKT